jgi:hypothetical protein
MLYENRAGQRADAGVGGFSGDFVQSLYHTMEVTPVKHPDRNAYYADLPHLVLDLPGTWPVGIIQPLGAWDVQYAKIPNPAFIGSDWLLQAVTTYVWWETINDDGQRKTRLWFSAMGNPVCAHTVQAYVSIENFGPDDLAPGGTAVLNMTIDMAAQYFQAQRQIPGPGINNEADVNDTPNR